MGEKFLIDTNAVIDYLGMKLPSNDMLFMDGLEPIISVATRIELLGWTGFTPKELVGVTNFVNDAFIYPLEEAIILQTILLKQHIKIKLGDAIIASTALTNNLTIITRNLSDFVKVPNLKIVDPYSL